MDFKKTVKKKYGEFIREKYSCCDACCAPVSDIFSFGEGNPVEFAGLKSGEKAPGIGSGPEAIA